MDIQSRFLIARKFLNLSQAEVAIENKMQQKTVSDIENGKVVNIPNHYFLYFYTMGISLEWLYTGEGEMQVAVIKESSNASGENLPSNPGQEFSSNQKEKTGSGKISEFEKLIDQQEKTIQHLEKHIKSQEQLIEWLLRKI